MTTKKMMLCEIIENRRISKDIFDLRLKAPEIAHTAQPGQFVEVYLDDNKHLLPRPLSICEAFRESGVIRVVYQRVGEGTEYLSDFPPKSRLRVLGPLGNGFDLGGENNVAVVGGGIGTPPLLGLCAELKRRNPAVNISVFLGFRSSPVLAEDFEDLGLKVKIATDDGSEGFHGNVVELIDGSVGKEQSEFERIYSCGPKVMLKFLAKWAAEKQIPCQVSLEERMACGIGACVGCVVKIKREKQAWAYKKVCKDGPVFSAGEVVWDE